MTILPKCDTCGGPGDEEDDEGTVTCDNCRTNMAEAAWARYHESFHDGGSTSWKSLEQQQADAKKLK